MTFPRVALAFLVCVSGSSWAASVEDASTLAPRSTLEMEVPSAEPSEAERYTGRVDVTTPEQPLKTVLGPTDLKARSGATLKEILSTQAGIDLSQTNPAGGPLTASLRGTHSQHLLVIVDGIPLNDPSQPSGGADLQWLPVDAIERIEIHRGPHPRWGSGALGGILEITTKEPGQMQTSILSGSVDSIPSVSASGLTDHGDSRRGVRVSARLSQTQGLSSASSNAGNSERDGSQNLDVSLRARHRLGDDWNLALSARHVRTQADGDFAGGVNGDDPNQTSSGVLTTASADLSAHLSPVYRPSLRLSALWADRTVSNPTDPAHPVPDFQGRYKTQALRADFNHKIKTSERNDLDFGVDATLTTANFTEGSSFSGLQGSLGLYADNRLRLFSNRVELREMARAEGADGFAPTIATRFTPTFWIFPEQLSLHGSAGSGYKLPSFYQRFSTDVGSPDLAKERVHSLEVGLSGHLDEGRAHAALVGFKNDYLNMIEFNNVSGRFENRKGQTWGAEFRSHWQVSADWTVAGTYTFQRGFDADTGQTLLRRPQDKASLTVTTQIARPFELSAELVGVGARDDESSTLGRVRLPSYALVNLSGLWKPSRAWTVYSRLSNLTNTQYEDIVGYGTPGITLTSGFSYSF